MIGLMPRYVPRAPRKRLPFSRSRKRRLPASSGMFWEGTPEFPIATIRPRDGGHVQYAIGALTRWLVARWSWFKPRSIPVVVATLGMVGIVALSDYLAHHIDQKAPVPAAKTSQK
jgi:hypothetical protein